MASNLKALLDKQKELQLEAESLQHRIDCEVKRNIYDYLHKATNKHGQEFVASVLTDYVKGEELEEMVKNAREMFPEFLGMLPSPDVVTEILGDQVWEMRSTDDGFVLDSILLPAAD